MELSRKIKLLTLEEAWNNVLPVLKEIFETSKNVEKKKLLYIYINVERYCSVRHDDIKIEKVLTVEMRNEWPVYFKLGKQFISFLNNILYYIGLNPSHHQKPFNAGTRSWQFYLKLKEFFTLFCKSLVKKSAYLADEELLRFNVTEWNKYASKRLILNWAFEFLNRNYAGRGHNRKEGSERIYEIAVLAVISWKETLFKQYNHKIVKTSMKLLNLHRQGETIDSTLISDLVHCYLALGICVNGNNNSLCIYKNHFEKVLLEETVTFYDTYSSTFLQNHSVMEYLEEVENIFRAEKQKVDDYFHWSTEELLMETLNGSLIERHWELLNLEFKEFLTLDKNDYINRMYSILSMHIKDLSEFAKAFEEHVLGEGLASIESCGEVVKTDGKIYTDAILAIYKKYLNMVKYEFSGNEYLMAALQKATKQFVNENFATLPPNTARKSSQLVCKYYDALMRKKGLVQNNVCETPKSGVWLYNPILKYGNCDSQIKELMQTLSEVLIVFTFLEDKDAFQEYHMQLIAKRLVNDISDRDVDLENKMVIQMKSVTGDQYTKNFERMIRDIKLSIALNRNFAKAHREPLEVDFKVKVLQSGLWPFKSTPLYTLPFELKKCIDQFSKFHSAINAKKRLCWLYDLSNGEIITKNYKNCYTIQASTMQISVLLLFNNSTSWTLGEIQEQTHIKIDFILDIVAIFLKIKLLTCKNAENLIPSSMICLNEQYNNRKRFMQIDVPRKPETQKKEQKSIDENIDKARILVLQTTIVRIMKSRKTMKKVDLISEILEDSVLQFKPDIDMIKKCIETLIEKEYIHHSFTEASTLMYVP